MPSGYGSAMTVFNKIKATIYIPKKKGAVAHLDDGYRQGKTMQMILVREILSHTAAISLTGEKKLKIKNLRIQI